MGKTIEEKLKELASVLCTFEPTQFSEICPGCQKDLEIVTKAFHLGLMQSMNDLTSREYD